MSRAYKNRRKAIRDEKRRLGVKVIPSERFEWTRSEWRAALDGPFLGTLEDFMRVPSHEGGPNG